MSGEAEAMLDALIPLPDRHARWAGHMSPGVDWIQPEEYYRTYNHLMGDDTMEQAAFTKPKQSYPDYVNARFNEEGKLVLVVRGDPNAHIGGSDDGSKPTAMIVMDLDDWDQFIASTRMLRRPEPAQPELPIDGDFSGYVDMAPEHTDHGGTELEHPEPQPLRDDDLSGALPSAFFDPHPEGSDRSGGATAGDPLNQRGPGSDA